jgi:hypothetical protein
MTGYFNSLYLIYFWEDDIKMDLEERGWDAMERINMAEDLDQWRALVNLGVP